MKFTTASVPVSARKTFRENLLLKIYITIFFIVWAITFINTTDRVNWIIENILTLLLISGLVISYRKFHFSDLSYTLIFLYILLHIYGAQDTYAENAAGYWIRDTFGLERNPYDRIVHCAFGLLLTYPMRDYFKNWFEWPEWVCRTLPVEITMSFSAAYELLEWLVADIFFKEHGANYLGTQGDVWDAQKDMGIAFAGAVFAMVTFSLIKRFMKK